MGNLNVLKDKSEVVGYNDPEMPIYANDAYLSWFSNMEAFCHCHDDIEYTRAVTGHMTYFVEGKIYDIKEGDALIVNSHQLHYGFSADKTDCFLTCVTV